MIKDILPAKTIVENMVVEAAEMLQKNATCVSLPSRL